MASTRFPSQGPTYYDQLMLTGNAFKSVLPDTYNYGVYALGFGGLGYMGDYLKENRPRGESVMTDDFWKYTVDGLVDLSKFLFWSYDPDAKPSMGGSSNYAAMAPSSYGSTAMRWGSGGGGLMGASNPGVNRVAGQY
jgi:hypothetical protein